MKFSLIITLLFNTLIMMSQQSVHEFTITTIDGESKNLSDFKGKKMLFVNTASQCGFTPQYMELQEVHEKYGEDLVIIGFPANNFGGQEPGSNDQIKTFCQKNYGVTFPIFEKVSVKGKSKHYIYQWLTEKNKNGKKNVSVLWNFQKFIIDENGQWVDYFLPTTSPKSKKIVKWINS